MEVTRQQLVYFDATALGDRLMNLPVFSDLQSGFYAIPTVKDGRIKVANHHPGPAGHPDGDSRKVTPEFRTAARAFLAQHLPELANAEEAWEYVCFYSGTADRDFILDRTADGLVVGAGFSGHGFKFGPLIGRLLAQMALNQTLDRGCGSFFHAPQCAARGEHQVGRLKGRLKAAGHSLVGRLIGQWISPKVGQ